MAMLGFWLLLFGIFYTERIECVRLQKLQRALAHVWFPDPHLFAPEITCYKRCSSAEKCFFDCGWYARNGTFMGYRPGGDLVEGNGSTHHSSSSSWSSDGHSSGGDASSRGQTSSGNQERLSGQIDGFSSGSGGAFGAEDKLQQMGGASSGSHHVSSSMNTNMQNSGGNWDQVRQDIERSSRIDSGAENNMNTENLSGSSKKIMETFQSVLNSDMPHGSKMAQLRELAWLSRHPKKAARVTKHWVSQSDAIQGGRGNNEQQKQTEVTDDLLNLPPKRNPTGSSSSYSMSEEQRLSEGSGNDGTRGGHKLGASRKPSISRLSDQSGRFSSSSMYSGGSHLRTVGKQNKKRTAWFSGRKKKDKKKNKKKNKDKKKPSKSKSKTNSFFSLKKPSKPKKKSPKKPSKGGSTYNFNPSLNLEFNVLKKRRLNGTGGYPDDPDGGNEVPNPVGESAFIKEQEPKIENLRQKNGGTTFSRKRKFPPLSSLAGLGKGLSTLSKDAGIGGKGPKLPKTRPPKAFKPQTSKAPKKPVNEGSKSKPVKQKSPKTEPKNKQRPKRPNSKTPKPDLHEPEMPEIEAPGDDENQQRKIKKKKFMRTKSFSNAIRSPQKPGKPPLDHTGIYKNKDKNKKPKKFQKGSTSWKSREFFDRFSSDDGRSPQNQNSKKPPLDHTGIYKNKDKKPSRSSAYWRTHKHFNRLSGASKVRPPLDHHAGVYKNKDEKPVKPPRSPLFWRTQKHFDRLSTSKVRPPLDHTGINKNIGKKPRKHRMPSLLNQKTFGNSEGISTANTLSDLPAPFEYLGKGHGKSSKNLSKSIFLDAPFEYVNDIDQKGVTKSAGKKNAFSSSSHSSRQSMICNPTPTVYRPGVLTPACNPPSAPATTKPSRLGDSGVRGSTSASLHSRGTFKSRASSKGRGFSNSYIEQKAKSGRVLGGKLSNSKKNRHSLRQGKPTTTVCAPTPTVYTDGQITPACKTFRGRNTKLDSKRDPIYPDSASYSSHRISSASDNRGSIRNRGDFHHRNAKSKNTYKNRGNIFKRPNDDRKLGKKASSSKTKSFSKSSFYRQPTKFHRNSASGDFNSLRNREDSKLNRESNSNSLASLSNRYDSRHHRNSASIRPNDSRQHSESASSDFNSFSDSRVIILNGSEGESELMGVKVPKGVLNRIQEVYAQRQHSGKKTNPLQIIVDKHFIEKAFHS